MLINAKCSMPQSAEFELRLRPVNLNPGLPDTKNPPPAKIRHGAHRRTYRGQDLSLEKSSRNPSIILAFSDIRNQKLAKKSDSDSTAQAPAAAAAANDTLEEDPEDEDLDLPAGVLLSDAPVDDGFEQDDMFDIDGEVNLDSTYLRDILATSDDLGAESDGHDGEGVDSANESHRDHSTVQEDLESVDWDAI